MGLFKKLIAIAIATGTITTGSTYYVITHPVESLSAFASTAKASGQVPEADEASMEAVRDTLKLFEPYFKDMIFTVPLNSKTPNIDTSIEISYEQLMEVLQEDFYIALVASEFDNNPDKYPDQLIGFYNYMKGMNAAEENNEEFTGSYTFSFGDFEHTVTNRDELDLMVEVLVQTIEEHDDTLEGDLEQIYLDDVVSCAAKSDRATCFSGLDYVFESSPETVIDAFIINLEVAIQAKIDEEVENNTP
jgi:hypothetical protein